MIPIVVLCVFAVYVISLVVTKYGGPFNVFMRLRAAMPDSPFICFVCFSFYVALVFGIACYLDPLELFAVWGGAVIVYKLGEK